MPSTAQLATIGHLTAGPATNVDSRVDVRVECEAALQAGKRVLGLSVLLGGMPRVRALAAAVAGIDRDQQNTCQRSLLAQKGAKLMERPTAQSGTLLFPNRYPVVDALQLFQGDAALGAFGLGNDLLQDAVIDVSSKASFFATDVVGASVWRCASSSSAISSAANLSDSESCCSC